MSITINLEPNASPSEETKQSAFRSVQRNIPTELIISTFRNKTDQLVQLKQSVEILAPHFPIRLVQQFDAATASDSMLNLFHRTVGFSYAFHEEVRENLQTFLGKYAKIAPSLPRSRSVRISACNDLLQKLNPHLQEIQDKNLVILWKEIVVQQKWDPAWSAMSADEIRAWIDSTDNSPLLEQVVRLDLSGSAIEILPPEILACRKLQEILLTKSNLTDYPAILQEHPNKPKAIYELEDFVRFKGSSSSH